MRKWMFVCAVVAAASFFADSASAQPAPTTTTPGTVITSGDGVVMQQRTGLFRGRRNRGQMVSTSQPMTTVTPSTTTTPPVVQTQGSTGTVTPIQGDNVQTRVGLLGRLRVRR